MKGSVLYIEDEFFFANTISTKLKEHDFGVDTASDGALGLRMVKEKEYDLVLLDLLLPEIGGFEILEKLKSDPATKSVPVIILSNLSSESDKQRAHDLGAHAFSVKINTTPNEILAMVTDIVGEEPRG